MRNACGPPGVGDARARADARPPTRVCAPHFPTGPSSWTCSSFCKQSEVCARVPQKKNGRTCASLRAAYTCIPCAHFRPLCGDAHSEHASPPPVLTSTREAIQHTDSGVDVLTKFVMHYMQPCPDDAPPAAGVNRPNTASPIRKSNRRRSSRKRASRRYRVTPTFSPHTGSDKNEAKLSRGRRLVSAVEEGVRKARMKRFSKSIRDELKEELDLLDSHTNISSLSDDLEDMTVVQRHISINFRN